MKNKPDGEKIEAVESLLVNIFRTISNPLRARGMDCALIVFPAGPESGICATTLKGEELNRHLKIFAGRAIEVKELKEKGLFAVPR